MTPERQLEILKQLKDIKHELSLHGYVGYVNMITDIIEEIEYNISIEDED